MVAEAPSAASSAAPDGIGRRAQQLIERLIDEIELPPFIRPLKKAALEYIRQELSERSDEEWRQFLDSAQKELIPWLLTGEMPSK
jgi:hypothetical protein